MLKRFLGISSLLAIAAVICSESSWAAQGMAHPWQMGFQNAYSPVMERVHAFHNTLLVVIIGIVIIVLGLLGFIIFRFNAKRNPVPSKTAHNTLLEVVWTLAPVVILFYIAVPSMRLLFFSDRAPNYDMTLKVTGHQWYWSYNYPDQGDITFDSVPIAAEDLKPGQPRLLTVDNRVVLPVNTIIQVLVASDDVIHDWAVPSLGLKKDATPGRVNETWVEINQEGTYYGMCSELCGVNHYYMPIQIEAVSKEKFAAWVEDAKKQFSSRDVQPEFAMATSR